VLDVHAVIEDRNMAALTDATDPMPKAHEVIDATGRVVVPCAIDTHPLRNPWHSKREDFTTRTTAQ
jgi:cytosine/adenosine deaminase-related metal-dependent hydrolase